MPTDRDYRLEIRVRNGRLLRAMHARGFKTAAALSRASGVQQGTIGEYLSLRLTPYRGDEIRPTALRVASTLGRKIEDLWPPQHLDTPLPQSSVGIDLSLEDIRDTMTSDIDVEQIVGGRLEVRRMLAQLSPRHRNVVMRRYGIDQPVETLEDVARDHRLTRERVRQMECKALRILRHQATTEDDETGNAT